MPNPLEPPGRRPTPLLALLALVACGGAADPRADAEADGRPTDGLDDEGASDADGEPPTTEVSFLPLDGDAPNPERGFYRYVDLLEPEEDLDGIRDEGLRLVYAGIALDDWAEADLPASLSTDLEAAFARVRAAGLKVVLRFAYNDGPIGAPDASQERILAHLSQLAPRLAADADVIALLQAGFLGTWGEWHHSTHGLDTPEHRGAVLRAILAALPTSRLTAVRTPNFKEETFPGGPLTAATAFTGEDAARVGHHNDCFLASDDDEGTYPDPIETWKDYVAQEGRFTPAGGETCADNPPRSACASAMAELERLHFSYLNDGYHPDVLASWEADGCLEEIRARLGYRFVLSDASWTARVRPGGLLHLRFTLANSGYAAPYNARPLLVVLSAGGRRWIAEPPDTEVRRWEPGAPVVLDWRLRLPETLPPADYTLALGLPDAAPSLADRPDYAVRFANDDVWDAAAGTNVLTTALPIAADGDSAPGAEAAAFVER